MRSCAVPLLLGALAVATAPAHADETRDRALALHHDSIVIDGHNDVPTVILDFGFDLGMDGAEDSDRGYWTYFFAPWLPGRPTGEQLRTDTDIARMRSGGLDASFFSIWVPPRHYDPARPDITRARALAQIEAVREQVRLHPEDLGLAVRAGDVRRIAADGRIAVLLGLEGGHAFGSDLELLRRYASLGVRYVSLTWSFSHEWADSSGDDGLHGGLTDFGREVVRELNRLGVLVDVSHVSDATFWDVMETARTPVIASHSSARALAPHARNLSDEMLLAVAENGGVVMLNFGGIFLDARKTSTLRLAWNWLVRCGNPTTVAMLADHAEHVARVAGVDHVGIGSDYDGTLFMPEGMSDVAGIPELTVELARRGWSNSDLRKLLGENVLRVMAAAEEHARVSSLPESEKD